MTLSKPLMKDILASIVVLLVAIPLCLGISVAVGLPPTTGLIAGIIGGLVVSSLGGAPLQVSGPAAGLITIVWEIVQTHGVEHLGIIVLSAGFLQVVFSYLRLGLWFRAVSPAIIHGMLAGIGLLIFASQFHVMVDDLPQKSWFENVIQIPASLLKGLFAMNGNTHHLAAMIGVLTIAIIALWKFLPKSVRVVPAPLVAVLASALVADVLNFPIKFVEVPQNLWADINWITWDDFGYVWKDTALASVLTVAIVASMESLLTAVSIDKLHSGERANYDKELRAQGIGNLLAGLFGALPITGVIVRSAANIQAGAVSRLSGVLHGLWLLVFLVAFPSVLGMIPVSCLAAILVYTGYKLVHTENIKDLWAVGKSEFAIYVITALSIVFTSLLEGIIIGVVLTAAKFMWNLSNLKIIANQLPGDENVYIQLEGNANFVCLPRIATVLETLPDGKRVHIALNRVAYIDHSCLEFLTTWQSQYQERGGMVLIEGDLSIGHQCVLPMMAESQ